MIFMINIFQNYGKIPRCIVKVRTRVETAEAFNEDETSRILACQYIDKEERKKLLDVSI